MEPFGTIRNRPEPSGTIRNHSETFGTNRNHSEPSGTFQVSEGHIKGYKRFAQRQRFARAPRRLLDVLFRHFSYLIYFQAILKIIWPCLFCIGLHRDPFGTGPFGKDRKGQEANFGGSQTKFLEKSSKTMKITKNINFGGPGGQNPRSVSRDDSKSPHAVVN